MRSFRGFFQVKLAPLILLGFLNFKCISFAQVSIYEGYIIINGGPNSGDYYYELKDNGGTNTTFSSFSISRNLLSSPSLTLKGGEVKTSSANGDYQNANNTLNLQYRIYRSGASAGAYTDLRLDNMTDTSWPTYQYDKTGQNISLLSGLDSGTWKIDAQLAGNASWGSQNYYNMSSAGFSTATVDLFYGATANGTQASAFTGSGYFNFNGSGQTYTLNAANTYTGQTQIDAGTVDISGSGSLSSSSAVFIGSGVNGNNAQLTLSGSTASFGNNITINISTGSGTRTLAQTGSTAQTLSGSFTMNRDVTINVTGSGLTISGVMSGGSTFTKTGTGSLTLSGSSANTFSAGTVTVSAGTLILNKSANISAIAGRPVDIASGATMRTDAAGQIGSAPLVTVTGTFDLNGNSQTVALAGGGSVKLDGSAASGTLTISNSGTDTFSGTISDNARTDGAVTKAGTGTQILTGNNDYDGTTTVSAGVLRIGHANALGSATGATTVSSGAALEFSNATTMTISEALTINGTGVGGSGGAIKNIQGNNYQTGAVTLNSSSRIAATSGNLVLQGGVAGGSNVLYLGTAGGNVSIDSVISGSGATQDGTITSLFKDGTGTLTLTGANTYSGDTRITQGTLTVNSGGSLGNGTSDVFISSGATLNVNTSTTVDSVR